MTRIEAHAALIKAAQRVVDDPTRRIDSLEAVQASWREMLLFHVCADLLLTVVTDEQFNRAEERLRATTT